MTAHTNPTRAQRRIAHAVLDERIAGLLARSSFDLETLASVTGHSQPVLRRRLYVLAADDRAHAERKSTASGLKCIWHSGPYVPPADPSQARHGHYQPTFRVYPPIGRRDPLVSALHGMGPAPSLMLEMEH